jgi:hypothetical protein
MKLYGTAHGKMAATVIVDYMARGCSASSLERFTCGYVTLRCAVKSELPDYFLFVEFIQMVPVTRQVQFVPIHSNASVKLVQ